MQGDNEPIFPPAIPNVVEINREIGQIDLGSHGTITVPDINASNEEFINAMVPEPRPRTPRRRLHDPWSGMIGNNTVVAVDPGDTPIDQIPVVDLTDETPGANEPTMMSFEEVANLVSLGLEPPSSRTRYFQRLLRRAGRGRRERTASAPPGPPPGEPPSTESPTSSNTTDSSYDFSKRSTPSTT